MPESQQVEWKESWRDEYLKWVCGFAHAQGGVLEIGRNDKGIAVGVADADKLMEDLPNKIRDVLGIVPSVERFTEDGCELVRINVQAYPNPISYKGQYHVRSGSTKQELKGAALDHFLLSRYGRRWDGTPVPGVEVSNLSATAIENFRKRAAKAKRLSPEALEIDDQKRLQVLHGWYRQLIRDQLPELLGKWQPIVGVEAKDCRIKKMKTKWGACNIEDRLIWLNLELAKKPLVCLEYILVHELVHLLKRHHNDRFRDFMDFFLPNLANPPRRTQPSAAGA